MKHRVMMILGLVLLFTLFASPAVARRDDDDTRRIIGDDVADTPVEVQAQNDAQHGSPDGHLPATSENVELIGKVSINGAAPGRVADVAAFGNYAYLTVRDPEGCSGAGVAIIDISNPAQPRQVGFIDATEGAFPGEGAQVLDMKTRSFRGQVLVFNNELCALGSEAGISLWDVTNPLSPVVLSANVGDNDPGGAFSNYNQTHSAFAWEDKKRAFVVIVDNEETTDVDILEITDPRNPVLLTELDLNDYDVAQPELLENGSFPSSNLHDMVVQKVRGQMTMLLSYWDGGWVLLNVENPANPQFIADSEYPFPDTLVPGLEFPEGNAHQAEFSPNGKFIIGTDEDFTPFTTSDLKITTGPNAGEYDAVGVSGGAPVSLLPDRVLNGPVVYGGYGCDASAPIPPASQTLAGVTLQPGEEKIVVLQRGPTGDPGAPEAACFPGEKAANAIEAGYDAVVLVNRHLGSADADVAFCGSGGFPEGAQIVTVCTTHTAFHRLFNTEPRFEQPYAGSGEPQVGQVGQKIEIRAVFDGWGYVRLLDARTLEQIDAYAIDEALDPQYGTGYGALSVHEVAVDPWNKDIAYLSYYAGGLRVIKYGNNGIEEVGRYIAEGGNDFWGVEVHRLPKGTPKYGKETLILASDRDTGLWIFRYTGK